MLTGPRNWCVRLALDLDVISLIRIGCCLFKAGRPVDPRDSWISRQVSLRRAAETTRGKTAACVFG